MYTQLGITYAIESRTCTRFWHILPVLGKTPYAVLPLCDDRRCGRPHLEKGLT